MCMCKELNNFAKWYMDWDSIENVCDLYRTENLIVRVHPFEHTEIFDLNGVWLDTARNDAQLCRWAMRENEDYEEYEGRSNLHILIDGADKIHCDDCPHFADCEQIDESINLDDDVRYYGPCKDCTCGA